METEMAGDVVTARRGSAVHLTAASLVATAVGIATGPLMARALGPAGRGEVAAATVYAALAALVAGLGVPTAVGYAAATRSHPTGALLATLLRFAAVLVPPLAATGVLLTWLPLADLSASGRLWSAVLVASVPAAVLAHGVNALLVAEGALRPLTRLRIVPAVVAGAATVAAFAAGVLTVAVALAIAVATSLGIAAMALVLLRARPAGRADFRWLVAFGLRSYPANLAVFATHLVDQAFIVAILGPRDLGFYAVAVTISSIPNAVWLAVYSRFFSLVADEPDPAARSALVSQALRLTLLGSLAVAAAIAATAPVLLPVLYGEPFRRSVAPLLLLLPGSVVFGVSMVGESCLTALGRPGRVTWAELSGFAVTITCLPFTLRHFGIVGAAVLSTASYLVVLLVCLAFLRSSCTLSLRPTRRDLAPFAALVRDTAGRLRGSRLPR